MPSLRSSTIFMRLDFSSVLLFSSFQVSRACCGGKTGFWWYHSLTGSCPSCEPVSLVVMNLLGVKLSLGVWGVWRTDFTLGCVVGWKEDVVLFFQHLCISNFKWAPLIAHLSKQTRIQNKHCSYILNGIVWATSPEGSTKRRPLVTLKEKQSTKFLLFSAKTRDTCPLSCWGFILDTNSKLYHCVAFMRQLIFTPCTLDLYK